MLLQVFWEQDHSTILLLERTVIVRHLGLREMETPPRTGRSSRSQQASFSHAQCAHVGICTPASGHLCLPWNGAACGASEPGLPSHGRYHTPIFSSSAVCSSLREKIWLWRRSLLSPSLSSLSMPPTVCWQLTVLEPGVHSKQINLVQGAGFIPCTSETSDMNGLHFGGAGETPTKDAIAWPAFEARTPWWTTHFY